MRKIFVLAMFLSVSVAYSEIVDWLGMSLGADPRPDWLFSFIDDGKETEIRRRFEVEKNQAVFYGVGQALDVDEAKSLAASDCKKKVLQRMKKQVSEINTLQRLYVYWEEDDEKGFTVYSIYTMKR